MAATAAYSIGITATTLDGSAISGESGSVDLTILDACTAISAVTAPVTTAQAAALDGTALTYTVPSWTAVADGADDFADDDDALYECEPGLLYTWDVPAALVADSTTSTSSRVFAFTSSTVALAGTYTISVTATTSTGAAIATGGVATFTLTLTAPNAATTTPTSGTQQTVQQIISTISATLVASVGAAVAA